MYKGSTKGQINVTPSLPKAYGYVPYLIGQRFLQIKLRSNFLLSRDPRHAVSTSLATLIKGSLALDSRLNPSTPQFFRYTEGIGSKKINERL